MARDQGARVFAEVVRAQRQRLGLTQEDLASKAGLGVRTIRKIEAGQVSTPRPTTVRLLG
jgi:transcriptional regulator with XRE-family HTH domain